MLRTRLIVGSALVIAAVGLPPRLAMAIPVPSGQEPSASDTRFDAMCAVGRKNRLTGPNAYDWFDENGIFDPDRNGGNTGSGTLIAPDMVLTARHLWPDVETLDGYFCTPGPGITCPSARQWVVRFRRHPDGTVGTMNEFPVPPSTVRGPESFFHVNVIAALEFGPGIDMAILFLETPVTHIEPVPVAAVNQRPFNSMGFLSSQYDGDTTPANVLFEVWMAGWGSGTGINSEGSGQLRYRDALEYWPLVTRDRATAYDFDPDGQHDSGSPFLRLTDAGHYVATSVAVSGGIVQPGLWRVHGMPAGLCWERPEVSDELISSTRFDVTGSASPADASYGGRNGRTDVADMLYAAARIAQGDSAFDLTGSADPNDAGYGIPDNACTIADLEYFCREAALRDDEATPWPLTVLLPHDADNDGDRRFTRADYTSAAISSEQIAKYDFDGDQSIEPFETDWAELIHDYFGHGVLGDITEDDLFDQDDIDVLVMLATTGDIWDDTFLSDPLYRVALDDNLDGHLTIYDRCAMGFRLLPGDVGAPTKMTAFSGAVEVLAPDFDVSRWDTLSVFYKLLERWNGDTNLLLYLDTSGSGNPGDARWGVADGVTDGKDFKHYLWRRHQVFGSSPGADDPARMLPAFDVNGDGRFNAADHDALSQMDPNDPDMPLWDLNGTGDPALNALLLLGALTTLQWDQGVLGDFDGDGVADCADYLAMHEAINCQSDDLFDGRTFFTDDANGYTMILDADLDGDNDADDRAFVTLQALQVPDVNLDGEVDSADAAIFSDLLAAGHPAADIAAPFGEVDVVDFLEFLDWCSEGAYGETGPIPCLEEPTPID